MYSSGTMKRSNDDGDFGRAFAQFPPQAFRLGVSDVRPNSLDPRPVGGCRARLVGPAPERLRAALRGVNGQLVRDSGLSDAPFALDHQEPAPSGHRLLEADAQYVHRLVAPDEDASNLYVEGLGACVGVIRSARRRAVHAGLSAARLDAVECLDDLGGRPGPPDGVLGQHPQDEGFERFRALRVVPGRGDRLGFEMLTHHGGGVVSHEGGSAADHLVEDDAEAVQVGARGHFSCGDLFGGHVGDGADDVACPGEAGVVGL